MTTWINSQFPRPDFHRQVQRHYGLQDTELSPFSRYQRADGTVRFARRWMAPSARRWMAPSAPLAQGPKGVEPGRAWNRHAISLPRSLGSKLPSILIASSFPL